MKKRSTLSNVSAFAIMGATALFFNLASANTQEKSATDTVSSAHSTGKGYQLLAKDVLKACSNAAHIQELPTKGSSKQLERLAKEKVRQPGKQKSNGLNDN